MHALGLLHMLCLPLCLSCCSSSSSSRLEGIQVLYWQHFTAVCSSSKLLLIYFIVFRQPLKRPATPVIQ
jgi:hypothetical protein